MKLLYILIFIFLFPFCVIAQKESTTITREVGRIINREINSSQFKDTTATYAFAFKLHVVRKGNRTEVTEIVANDSLGYKLVPYYKSLAHIDYSSLGEGRKTFFLIIPVYIGTYGSKHLKFDESDYLKNPMDVFNKLFYSIEDMNKDTYRMPGFKKYIFPKSEELIYMYPFQLILDLKVYE